MKKYILLSAMTSGLLIAAGTTIPVASASEVNTGTVSGQLRAFYIDRTYTGTVENNRNSLNFGGWIGYDSPTWDGISFGGKIFGVYGAKIHDGSAEDDYKEDGKWTKYDPSLYGYNGENYIFLGEAFLNYAVKNTNIKIGRQKIKTPMLNDDDYRVLANRYEAIMINNSDFEKTKITLGHVTRATEGTFANAYSPGILSVHGGYGTGFTSATSGHFKRLSQIADAPDSTIGMSIAAVEYAGIENLKLQAWDYMAYDIVNNIYLQADYKFRINQDLTLTASAQVINQNSIGDELMGEIDGTYWGTKLTSSFNGFVAYIAYSQTGSSDLAEGNGGIQDYWGGTPAFTQGMVSRHMYFADTSTTKAVLSYKFKEPKIKIVSYYLVNDVSAKNTWKNGQSFKTKEAGADIIYQATDDLQLRLRGNFPIDFAEGLDWDEYRFIVNYNF